MKALVFLALLTVASSEKQNQLQYVDPFSLLDRHISHTFNYLWPWSKLVQAAAALEDGAFDEPQYISDKNKLQVKLNVKHFKPEELRVRVSGRTVVVEGRRRLAGGDSLVANQFEQRFALPAGSRPEEVTAELRGGVLAVQVPRRAPPPPPPDVDVPIVVLLPDADDATDPPHKKTDKPKKATKFTKTTEAPRSTTTETKSETPAAVASSEAPTTSAELLERLSSPAAPAPAPAAPAPAADAPLEQLELAEARAHVGKIRKKELKENNQM